MFLDSKNDSKKERKQPMNDIYSNDDVKRQLDDIEIKLHRIESMMVGFVMAF